MSAAEVIAKALCDSNPSNTQRFDDHTSSRQALWLHRANAAIDALEDSGFAIVKLPERRVSGTYVDVSAFADEIRIRTNFADVTAARSIAGQLLRAADQLEGK
jgi:hypothetical protein